MTTEVKWRGLSASYSRSERLIMGALTVREQGILHLLKAFTHGEIQEESVNSDPRMVKAGPQPDARSRDAAPEKVPSLFLDPEDIPFGPPAKKKRPVYALCWTWRHHRVYKTKAQAQRKLRVWKRWYERQGWKVTNHPEGYFAAKGSERHSISLHEYDKETRERLK